MYEIVEHVILLDTDGADYSNKIITNAQSKLLTLQVSQSAGLVFKVLGCSDARQETWDYLGVINLSTFDVTEEADGDGLYVSSIEGVYRVKLEIVSGTGRVAGMMTS